MPTTDIVLIPSMNSNGAILSQRKHLKGKTRGQMQKGKPGRKNLERETREGKLLRKGKPEREKGLLRLLRAKTGYSSSVLINTFL